MNSLSCLISTLQTEGTAQPQLICHHLSTKIRIAFCLKTNKKLTHLVSISYQHDLSKLFNLLWVAQGPLHRQQVCEYLVNRAVISVNKWSPLRSGQMDHNIRSKPKTSWCDERTYYQRICIEPVLWFRFFWIKPSLSALSLGWAGLQTSPYLWKDGIKGNFSDRCTFLGNMYCT